MVLFFGYYVLSMLVYQHGDQLPLEAVAEEG
jgi:hypothetical protein